MVRDRDELTAAVLHNRLKPSRTGIVLKGITNIDPVNIILRVADQLRSHIHAAIAGYEFKDYFNHELVEFSDGLEDAVNWRNIPDKAGSIVVFVKTDLPKLHSLGDFDFISSRELTRFLLEAAAKEAANIPESKFWDTLINEAETFPLDLVENFVHAVVLANRKNTNNIDIIPENMWRLGLLRDFEVLNSKVNPGDRIAKNRSLLIEMGQLSETRRRHMSSIVARSKGDEQKNLRKAYRLLMEYFRRGGNNILGQLDVSTVEELLLASRKKTAEKNTKSSDSIQDQSQPDFSNRPIRDRELRTTIADIFSHLDKVKETALHEYGEKIKYHIQNPQDTIEPVEIEEGFGGRPVIPEIPERDFLSLIRQACSPENFGGILHSPRSEMKDIIRFSTPDDFIGYNPISPIKELSDQSLFSLLRQFDQYIQSDTTISAALDQFIASRNILLEHLELLLADPLVLFGGYPEARVGLKNYLDGYSAILRLFHENEVNLYHTFPDATRFVATELLRLETISIFHTPEEWKALLTPLHPFHLWRFQEILKSVQNVDTPLSEDERKQLCNILPQLPHLLHFVILPHSITQTETISLPQSGQVENLPTYENHTNRYLGTDGLEYLDKILPRWLEEFPYSHPQIRIGFLDVPDLGVALKHITEFLSNSQRCNVVVDAYFTKSYGRSGNLSGLDYEENDYKIAEYFRSGRLVVNTHYIENLDQAAKSLANRPVHILFSFDQSHYQITKAPRAQHLIVSPLVVTYEYQYDPILKRGTIAPSSEAQEGLFAHYHFLVERAALLPAGEQLRLQNETNVNLKGLDSLIQKNATQWLCIADRSLTAYTPEAAILLDENRVGQREIGVWSGVTLRALDRLIVRLQDYNLRPQKEIVKKVLMQFSHVAAGGLLSLPRKGSNLKIREAKDTGFLGTILAAAWYLKKYPDALIASLDSNFARLWLQKRPTTQERADLIGLRFDLDDTIVIESIEVKTRAGNAEVRKEIDPKTNIRRLTGHAVDQLKAILDLLNPIFGGQDSQPFFTPARREALKYQVHRECFREVHDPRWKENWYERMKKIFHLPNPEVNVKCEGLILHIQLGENIPESIVTDDFNQVRLVKIGTPEIQKLVSEQKEKTVEVDSSPNQNFPNNDDSQKIILEDQSSSDSDHPSKNLNHLETAGKKVRKKKDNLPVKLSNDKEDEATEIARLFKRACHSFRIDIDACDPGRAILGPTVWRFYVRLARGQRLDPLRNALEDISREMRRSGILINEIKNSDEIALDVPRMNRVKIQLLNVLDKLPELSSLEDMPIPIGITPEGSDLIINLKEVVHLLVGGTTGAGKTMFLYGIISALLKTHPRPEALRLLVSTSKPEDFVYFRGIPHLETGRVIDDAAEAVELLQTYIATTFEERKQLLENARCRDISEFNSRGREYLAPLVVIVDEFADLADQLAGDRIARNAFYTQLRRVAQLGRNRGLHLILCTQRPSADLVPTNIRNLMNARVALHVNDSTASRMILEETGAEKLQLHGDLLFKNEGALIRAQGYFIDSSNLDELLAGLRNDKG